MFIKILKVKEDDHWAISDCPHQEMVKNIWGVYIFDPNWRVHCCEITASFELNALETQVEFHDTISDADRECIEDWFRQHEDCSCPITYMHCHTVDGASHYKEGWFPKNSMGVCRLWGFGTGFDFDPDDPSERLMREQRHDYALSEAMEYCRQNAV